ncbi:beta-ketoacyl-ACP synthase III [Crocosphaera watsonii WH 8501]|uniref:Beta-ketoacyl-[acyl-carrier-protein] synthase III n=5 Tax=Crocosphaera watsonii TaxID=263511 RepID=Q4C5L7_CROWT|nr:MULTISPECIES: beta-ketoacyl-ACP synthase III [Crocosphaera]EAM51488.1 Beta-ketoacyl-acyl carrier protein synthase III (FabH) [Crocosphaera watsonii WH 8501]EHJ13425.1 3-oxoacyl-[acyl-carrier-protein] synthase, KASIII [Crocosphaera watsonii WH 0003]MCH2246727.1 ketoacyl-ACP synthase III [Crocosphaera sp.]NQZ62766.1 ketoacyl-ACP synthase III [Crocosphaera sp.]CCQ51025.1 3-oxoacyl-[acyl-carrier-protein] synthase, KASIII [Crocosphaera watsonii WH 8502]
MKAIGVSIIGCGSAAPEQVMTNDDLSLLVETSDEWIRTRTGISKRHLASTDLSLSELSAQAGTQAIAMAQLTPGDIDLIILATSTADDLFGSAAKVQAILQANRAVAFDLTAACSGFVFALITASQFLRTGVYKNVLVIGADILSRWVDWSDRTTCVLFGDGAGAVVCQGITEEDNLLGFAMYSDGKQHDALNLGYHGTDKGLKEGIKVNQGTYQPITMKGRDVYRFAVEKVPEVIEKALFNAQLTTDDIDWLILHQANQRIIDSVAKRLKIPGEKVIANLDEYGNTSAASIPLALDEAVRQGKIKPGDIVASSGFGAGLTWGAAVFRWGS